MPSLTTPDSRYRSVVETMSEGVVVQGADGTTELCNARALELFGVTESELRASFSERSRWQAVRLDGTSFAVDELPVNVTLRTGEPTRDVVVGITRRSISKREPSGRSAIVSTAVVSPASARRTNESRSAT